MKAAMTRLYKFDNVLNFRDFGNYPTQGGRQVKRAKLFRSAHFNKTSEADRAKLSALGIGLLVDLRYRPERVRQPNHWPQSDILSDGTQPKTLEYTDPNLGSEHSSESLAPHEIFIKEVLNTAEEARAYMRQSYHTRPDDAGFRAIFSGTLKFMAATGEPIVIHCAAGKDRTGTLAALILSALGVSSKTIMEDYMMTMQAVDIERFLAPASLMMQKRYGRVISPDALRPLFHVEPSYLEHSMAQMADMERYITERLGITKTERQALRDYYLE